MISQGTETVNALTEALKRDEQRFSLPREDKQPSLTKQENNIAGSYFKTKYGAQNGDQVIFFLDRYFKIERKYFVKNPETEVARSSVQMISFLKIDLKDSAVAEQINNFKNFCTFNFFPFLQKK